jgi:hypothetical protein
VICPPELLVCHYDGKIETGSKSKSELSRTRSKFKRLSQLHFDFIPSSARNWKRRGNLSGVTRFSTLRLSKKRTQGRLKDSSSKRSPRKPRPQSVSKSVAGEYACKLCLLMSGDPYEKAGNPAGKRPTKPFLLQRRVGPCNTYASQVHRIRSAS